MKPGISVLVLAAGKGVRMKSNFPKVLHTVGGKVMIARALEVVGSVKPKNVCVVVGNKAELVKQFVLARAPKVKFAVQKVLDGSGGAARVAKSWIARQRGLILITCGDMPLLQTESLKRLLSTHLKEKNAATVLTADVDNPCGYGRIVRGYGGEVEKIVEDLDSTSQERDIREINTGTYCFNAKTLWAVLGKLKNHNAKKEFYLTDTLELIRAAGGRVGGSKCASADEASGINNRQDLAQAEKILRQRKLRRLLESGVTLIDPQTTYVDEGVQVGADTVIWPQTFLLGNTKIGTGCRIGPWSFIQDCQIENDVIFQASFAESSVIKREAKVGPYSRVRPHSVVGPRAHLGNFTEIKKTTLGEGAKANHLSYLGDAKIGKNVNIGAGTITCNYDGFRKHPTVIQDHAFIGSNVNLIAPIRIGAHAVVGAGSSLNENVPPWALALERAPRTVKNGWARRFKKRNKK